MSKTAVPDVYGQVHPEETPALLSVKLMEFRDEVNKLSSDAKKCIKQAQEKCPELLDDDFKLMFLRCEVFNAHLAAKRYSKYWDKRVALFGDKAFQPLTLDKALVDDEAALNMAFARILNGVTDPAGRTIIFTDPSRQDKTKYTRDSMTRSLWYVVHAALENVATQQKAVVMVVNPRKAKVSQIDRPQMKQNLESIQGILPVRISGILVCHPPTFFAIVFPIIQLFMHPRTKKRLQVFSGSEEKVLKSLEKFGLTKACLPSDVGGHVVLDSDMWYEERRREGK